MKVHPDNEAGKCSKYQPLIFTYLFIGKLFLKNKLIDADKMIAISKKLGKQFNCEK